MKKLHRSYRRLKNETTHGFKPKRHLWSENVGYPHPRRVIHSYPQGIKYPRPPPGKRDGRMPARLKTKKEDPPKRAFLARTLRAESLHNNIVVTVSLSNARST